VATFRTTKKTAAGTKNWKPYPGRLSGTDGSLSRKSSGKTIERWKASQGIYSKSQVLERSSVRDTFFQENLYKSSFSQRHQVKVIAFSPEKTK